MSSTPRSKKSTSTRNSRQPTTSTTLPKPVRAELVTKEGKISRKVGELTFTAEIAGAIVESIRGGMPIKMAAQYHRIPYPTVTNWLSRGDAGENPFQGFAIEVRQAQATFVHEMLEAIKEHGLGNAKQWTALMTLLERLYPEDFRRPTERSENLHLHGFVDSRIHQLLSKGEAEYTGA